mmetsp:Transcript_105431/g.296763  ORF Transcript_105431/g.296763 Transcript_105431/m.296763 type:complete len:208 (+) Transcript_105431:95-718(+)
MKVPHMVTKEDLRAHFSQFGELTDVFLPLVPGTTQHKGIAFVSFVHTESLSRALGHAPHEVQGQALVVDVAIPRPMVPGGAPLPSSGAGVPIGGRLFITKVAPDVTVIDLRSYFGQFGQLADVYVPPGGKSIAFVSYVDPMSAQHVLATPTHQVKPNRVVVVDQAIDRPPMGSKAKGKGALPGGAALGGAAPGFNAPGVAAPRFTPY